LILNTGVCQRVTKSNGSQKWEDCISWEDDDEWHDIDVVTGTHTYGAVKHRYRYTVVLSALSLSVMVIQSLLCIISIKYPIRRRVYQFIVSGLSITYVLLTLGSAALGSDTPLTDYNTWGKVYDCSATKDHLSYPDVGYFLMNTIAPIHIGVILFVIFFPSQFWCLHLVQNVERASSNIIEGRVFDTNPLCPTSPYPNHMGDLLSDAYSPDTPRQTTITYQTPS
jgi:hypothetical protein